MLAPNLVHSLHQRALQIQRLHQHAVDEVAVDGKVVQPAGTAPNNHTKNNTTATATRLGSRDERRDGLKPSDALAHQTAQSLDRLLTPRSIAPSTGG